MENKVIHSDPEIMGGTPVFLGTRVPVSFLFDYLEAGETIESFLESYPSVTRKMVTSALKAASYLVCQNVH
ncbi:DUF433 domain-containing protein [Duganella callida]|uniref:DUF433 domain-containing protein n=2 Tax=Duganella callida TaxID=2561932 RepID=A0A4Y9SKT0_9BURK|nr:DUF433 domain-containing protein [Duganella callida]